MFAQGRIMKPEVQRGSCILTVDNKTSLEINEKILKLLRTEEKVYLSKDEFDTTRGFPHADQRIYNMITPNGLPPHKLTLKVGSVVILLRNLNVSLGYCNGSRFRVTKLGENMIVCEPIERIGCENPLVLHRMAMTPAETNCRELAFTRWQIPVRLAYSMTINKAQGQTFDKVAIFLSSPCFGHGQFYTGVGRVRSFADLRIINKSNEDPKKARNIVIAEVLDKPQ